MDSSDFFGMDSVHEIVDEHWYEQNLELAAELGKALLEKNRELESQVNQLQSIVQDQTTEIQFLRYQVDTMRTMTESRNRIYEEVDRTAQDLENSNKKMLMEARADKQKLEKQSALICQLEDKVNDLEIKLEALKKVEKKISGKILEKRRTSSLNRLSVIDTNNKNTGHYFENLAWTYSDEFKNIPLNPYETEIRKLQDSIQHLKAQQTIDRGKYENLEIECSVLMEENQILEKKVKVLETKLSEAIMLHYELEQSRSSLDQLHQRNVIKSVSITDMHDEVQKSESKILNEIEHDSPELRSEAKAVKLQSGSSLYSSKESIYTVATVAKEIHLEDQANLSILDELESQYQTLFDKYEALIQNKGRTKEEDESHQQLAHKEVQTLLHITLSKDYCQDTSNIPPYKAIFRDIFAMLQRKRREESSGDHDGNRKSSLCCPIISDSDGTKELTDYRV